MEQEIVQHLSELVEAVKNVAPEVWAIYVRQQYVEAVVILVFAALALPAMVGCFRAMRKADYDAEEAWFAGTIFMGIVSVVVVVLMVLVAFPQLLNPEYYAIQALLP